MRRALLEEALARSEDTTSSPDSVALMNLSEIAALERRYVGAAGIGRMSLAAALDHGDQLTAVSAVFRVYLVPRGA